MRSCQVLRASLALVAFAGLLVWPGSGWADAVVPASQIFTCGSGFTFFAVGVGNHGTIVSLTSPAAEDQLVATGDQRFQVCYSLGGLPYVTAFDRTEGPDGGFGAAVAVSQPNGPNTFPLEITRTTADGALTITRRITGNSFVAPGALFDLNGDGASCSTLAECGNCTNRTIHVLTKVTNNTGSTATVRLVEIANPQLGGTALGDIGLVTNDAALMVDNGTTPGANYGLMLQSLIVDPLVAIFPGRGYAMPADCSIAGGAATPTAPGDWEMVLFQTTSIGPGGTNSGSFRTHYRRF